MKLTPEILFGDKPLQGQAPSLFSFSPDGKYLAYRAVSQDDKARQDLFRVNLTTGQSEPWLSANDIQQTSADITDLTAQERAERERRRDFSYGITQFYWQPHHAAVLLPINGQAYLLGFDDEPAAARAICPEDTRQTSFRFSPDGQFLSYVRNDNVYVCNVATGEEQQLTQRQHELEQFGVPDFLAAEEMHRFDAHWWSHDGQQLIYTRVDDSDVAVSHRLEIDGNGVNTIAQRYPYAGATNPHVELWAHDLARDTSRCIWRNDDSQAYLARVYPTSAGIVIAVQDRRQQNLSYLLLTDQGGWVAIHEEHSTTWVNLSDEFVEHEGAFYLTSEANDLRQVQRVTPDGQSTTIAGPDFVNQLHGVFHNKLYVSGWQGNATERHLYAIDLSGGSCDRLTEESGWHDITFASTGNAYIDAFTAVDTWLEVKLRAVSDGPEALIYVEEINANHPYAPFAEQHVKSTFGTIYAADGQPLNYRLTPPSDITGKHPVIVYVYGGPGAQLVTQTWGSLIVQLFAQQGYGVLQLDNRGSANRGRTFEAPMYRRMGTVEVADQLKGVEFLDSVSWVDTDRIGIFGHSYGGYMTLMALSKAPDTFAAGVAVAPVCDWSLYDSHYTERYMGLPTENEAGYAEGNVLSHIEQLSAPLLLMHGMADDNVLFTNTTKIMAALQETGKAFELMTYPGAKHSMQEPHVAIHRFNLLLDFFNRKLVLN